MINSYENKIHSEPLFSRKWILSWMSIITGALLFSTAYVLFINPYNIVPGGVYGLGIILHNFFPNIQVGTFGLCFDIPLLLIAFKIFGAHFGARTIIAALLIPLLMNGLTMIVGADPETMLNGHINLSNDILLSAIFGGVISGAGLGLIFRTHATSGGTDIISMIPAFQKHRMRRIRYRYHRFNRIRGLEITVIFHYHYFSLCKSNRLFYRRYIQ